MHLSGALPVTPNARKKRPELGSGGTGRVPFTRQVAVQPACRCTAHARACALPLFVVYLTKSPWFIVARKVGWESPCPLGKVLTYKNLIYY